MGEGFGGREKGGEGGGGRGKREDRRRKGVVGGVKFKKKILQKSDK